MNFVAIRRRLCWWKSLGNMERQLIFLLACVVTVQSNPCLVRLKRAFPHEESCGKYLICKRGVPEEYNCPDDFHFDTETLNCQPRHLAQCGLSAPNMETYVERKPLPTVPPTPAIVTCKPPDSATSEGTTKTPVYSTTTQSTAPEDALLTSKVTTTSETPSSTTVVPKNISDVQSSSFVVSKTTSDVQLSQTEVPKTTSDVHPSSSVIPQTISVGDTSNSEVPKTSSDVQPSYSVVPQTITDGETSNSEVPKTTSDVHPSSSEVPKTTYNVLPSSSVAPKTTSDVQSSSVIPIITSDIQPTYSEVPKTTSDVRPSSSEVSKTTSNVRPSYSEAPKTISDVQSSTFMVPKTTSEVQPSTTVVSKTTSDIPSSSTEFLTTSTTVKSLLTEFSATSSEVPRSPNKETPISSTTDVLEISDKSTNSTNSTPIVPPKIRHLNYLCNNNKNNYYVIPDPEDCKYFYYCIFGIPLLAKCPINFEFSSINLECLPAIVAGCNQTSTSIAYNKSFTLTIPPETTTSELPLYTSDLSTKAPSSSPKFIPTGAPPSTTEVPRPATEVPATTIDPHNRICNNTNNYYFVPDSKDCNRFYIFCENGNMIHETCPLDYEFSPHFLKCLPAVVAGCNHTTKADFAPTVTTSTLSSATDTSEVSITTTKASTITPKYTSSPDITTTRISSTTFEVSHATTVVTATTAESLDHTCDTSKYFLSPDPNDCRQFYLCAFGKLIHVACPLDYEFSSKILVCLPPSIAGCNITTASTHAPTTTAPTVPNTTINEILPTTTELAATTAEIMKTTFDVPSTATEITQSTKPSKNLCKNTSQNYYITSDPEDCKYFYICIFGNPLHGKCTENYEFSHIDLECLPAASAKCNHTTKTGVISAATTSIPMTTSSTLLQDATNTQALPSTTGIATITIESATSPKISITDISSTTTEVSSKPICEDTFKYYYAPDPNNCRRFYICAYGKLEYETCPLDYEFNTQLMECLPAALAGCNQTTTTTSSKTNTTSIHMSTTSTLTSNATSIEDSSSTAKIPIITTEITTSPKTTTVEDSSKTTELSGRICKNIYKYYYVPDTRNCSRYYVCAYGILEHETCPLYYEFNSLLMECMPAASAGCNYTTSTHNNKTTTSFAQVDTPISESSVITSETTFSPKSLSTKLPASTTEASRLSTKVLSLTTDLSSTTKEIYDHICKENTNKYYYAPDPKDCRGYYICNYGKVNHKTCPLNYEFSPLSPVCLPSSIAGCNNATNNRTIVPTTITPTISDTSSSVDSAITQQIPTLTSKFTPTTTEVSKVTDVTKASRPLNMLCKNKSSNYYVVPDPEDCNYYYFCIFGIPFLAKCTENNEFSPVDLRCLPAATAGCNHTTTQTTTTSTSHVPSPVIPTLTADTTTLKVPRTTTAYIPRPLITTDEDSTTTTIDVLPSTSKNPLITIDLPATTSKMPHGTVEVPAITSKIQPVNIDVPTTISKISHGTVEVPTVISELQPVNIDVRTTTSKNPHGTTDLPTTNSKMSHGTVEVRTMTSKIQPVNIDVPTTTSKIQTINVDAPTTISKIPHETIELPTIISKIIHGTTEVPTITSKIPHGTVELPTTISKIIHGTTEVPTITSKVPHGTVEVPTIISDFQPINIDEPTTISKIPHGTIAAPTTNSKIPHETIDVPRVTSKIPSVNIDVPTTISKMPHEIIEVPSTISKIIHGAIEVPTITSKIQPVTIDIPTISIKDPTNTTASPNILNTYLPKTTSAIPTTSIDTEIAKQYKPQKNMCKNQTNNYYVIPDPDDCKLFYICVFGVPIHGKCSRIEEDFSPSDLECMPSAKAGCNVVTSTTTISTTSKTLPTTTTEPATIVCSTTSVKPLATNEVLASKAPNHICNNLYKFYVFADRDDCNSFFLCIYGKLLHEKCPKDYEFSSQRLECLPAAVAGCKYNSTNQISFRKTNDSTATLVNTTSVFSTISKYRPTTELLTTTTMIPMTTMVTSTTEVPFLDHLCKNNTDNYYAVADPGDCEYFYRCNNGVAIHEKCLLGYEYSTVYSECLPTSIAGCNHTTTTISNPSSFPSSIPHSITEDLTSTASNSFSRTNRPRPTPIIPRSTTTLTLSTTVPIATPKKCNFTTERPIYYLPDKENCKQYYMCYYGEFYRETCPKDFEFSLNYMVCLPPDQAQCNFTHNTKSATTYHQLDQCTQDSPVHYYPDITNCNAYYICYHGISYHEKCPLEYNFDKETLMCIPEAESKCNITEQ